MFRHFAAVCAIPHGSGHTAALAEHCRRVAAAAGLEAKVDAAGNVAIRKPASPGREACPPVILQGHLDMVCEKTADSSFDFEREPLQLIIKDNWLLAKDTTLGGDDGIAVAMLLALAEDRRAEHPPLEILLTADEEIGLLGADALDPAMLTGRRMINLDSEEEGIFTVGCAGGVRLDLACPAVAEPSTAPAVKVTISGCRGGHSGSEIHKGRLNAIHALAALLSVGEGMRLSALRGGRVDNAIPREAQAVVRGADPARLEQAAQMLREQWAAAEPELQVEITPVEGGKTALAEADTARVLGLICALPDGVQQMSGEVPELVETSLNLGIVHLTPEGVTATLSLRSMTDAGRDALERCCRDVAQCYGVYISRHGAYPAWDYHQVSHITPELRRVYTRLYGREPAVSAIHAGLECAVFCRKWPGLDAVSLGPDMRDIHTPDERLNIPSVGRTYALLLESLRQL